ncbi:hypothetical protein QVD17_39813 [Tagetes erecta]|uniref:Protein kinase domain-containing protein n=1 Tax=Tagetes erecta TaxID=13708 RepID=A0AAD8JR81_TARER|nr:hypothetical protein QVD17_39813 [Tagetes erecta]
MDHPVLCEPIGIHGYTDPTIENTGGVSHKSDIYSFGVVLFEILCGRAAYIENATDELLAPMAKYQYENNSVKDIIHPGLWNEMSPQALVKYSNIAYSCLEEEPSHRPDINDIAKQLEVAVELQLRRENVVRLSI